MTFLCHPRVEDSILFSQRRDLTPRVHVSQIFRTVTSQCDAGASHSGGEDVVLLVHDTLVPLLLGMLHALGPPKRWRAAVQQAQQQEPAEEASIHSLPVSDVISTAAAECPHVSAYPGYRTAILSGIFMAKPWFVHGKPVAALASCGCNSAHKMTA